QVVTLSERDCQRRVAAEVEGDGVGRHQPQQASIRLAFLDIVQRDRTVKGGRRDHEIDVGEHAIDLASQLQPEVLGTSEVEHQPRFADVLVCKSQGSTGSFETAVARTGQEIEVYATEMSVALAEGLPHRRQRVYENCLPNREGICPERNRYGYDLRPELLQ